jgi:hypothetical protein
VTEYVSINCLHSMYQLHQPGTPCVKIISDKETGSMLTSTAFLIIDGIKSDILVFREKARLSHDLHLLSFDGHLRKYCEILCTTAIILKQLVLWQGLAVKRSTN